MSVESGVTTQYGEPVVDIVFEDQSARVALLGATVISWCTSNGRERLWMSSLSSRDGVNAIRGGVPIAFPQFANEGSLPLHGTARISKWTLTSHSASTEGVAAIFTLEPLLRYTVFLGRDRLRLELQVSATTESNDVKDFTACLHTYFKVDSQSVRLVGLKGLEYYDKVSGCRAVEEDDDLSVEKASHASGRKLGENCEEEGFVDRIYKFGGQRSLVLEAGDETYTIEQTGFPDTVVFNPWIADKKGEKGPDFDDDGYKHLICVEPCISRNGSGPVSLDLGASWKGTQEILIKKLR